MYRCAIQEPRMDAAERLKRFLCGLSLKAEGATPPNNDRWQMPKAVAPVLLCHPPKDPRKETPCL